MKKVMIVAEDFRDKAWGVADLGPYELVLEMTHGYSDLYFRDHGSHVAIMEELFYEEPNHNRINEYCRDHFGLEFVCSSQC